ncbi:Dihydroorotate dehydrogenase-domain-containing protein, partial [Phakopsora pachyrhizi]
MIRRTIYNSSNCISRFSSQSIRCCSNNSLRKELELSLRQQHHHQNYSTSTDSINGSVSNRLWNYTKLTGLLIGFTTSIVYLTDTRSSIHSWLSLPILNLISDGDPEKAHSLAVKALKFVGQKGLIKDRVDDSDRLSFELWGKKFKNPIGLAAGFDKDGDCIDGLFDIGFGYVEIGSITPEAQPGNPRPRLFKLSSTDSIINRYGFNSEGHLPVLIKLRNRILNFVERNRYSILNNDRSSNLDRDDLDLIQKIFEPSSSPIPSTEGQSLRDQEANDLFRIDERLDGLIEKIGLQNSLRPQSVLAINLGKNLTTATTDSIKDFKLGIQRFNHLADLLVINISSPNTPGLRDLQGKEFLEELLKDLIQTRDELGSKDEGRRKTPVLIKISPDLSVEELVEISEVAKESKVDGIIVSNTTIQRPIECGTEKELLKERGGLSGPPLKPLSLRALSIIYSNTQGTIPLIGCGGISSGRDVLDYGLAGASFVQLYSSLVFGGIGLPRRIKDELVELLDDYKD